MTVVGRGLLVAVIAAVQAVASPALTQALPDLDPMKLCRKQAEAVGQGDWLVKACLDQEQEAYNSLKETWETVDGKTRTMCIKQARAVLQGYWLIQACIEQELEARSEVESFKFKK